MAHTSNPRPTKIKPPVDPAKENMGTKFFVKQDLIAGGSANQLVNQIKSNQCILPNNQCHSAADTEKDRNIQRGRGISQLNLFNSFIETHDKIRFSQQAIDK